MSSSTHKAVRKTRTRKQNGGIIPPRPAARQSAKRGAVRARIANGRPSIEKAQQEGLASARHAGPKLKGHSSAERLAPEGDSVDETVVRTPGAVDLSWAEFQKSVRPPSSSSNAANGITAVTPEIELGSQIRIEPVFGSHADQPPGTNSLLQPAAGEAPGAEYQITTYAGADIEDRYATLRGALAVDLPTFDFAHAPCFGRIGCRRPNGDWFEPHVMPSSQPGDTRQNQPARMRLGRKELRILQSLQFSMNVQSAADIAELTGLDVYSWNSAALVARIAAIRRFLGDNAERQHFIITQAHSGPAYAWNVQRTWVWVERIKPASRVFLDGPRQFC